MLKTGERLNVKVLEINPQHIKYKRFDNLNDSLITIDKRTAERIMYENGVVERFVDTTMVTTAPTSKDSLRKEIMVGSAVRIVIDSMSYDGKVTFINQADSMASVVFRQDSLNQHITYKLSDLVRMQPIPLPENSGLATVMKLDSVSTQKPNPPSPEVLFERGAHDAQLYYRGYKTALICTILSVLANPILPFVVGIATTAFPPSRSHFTFPPDAPSQSEQYLAGYSHKARRIKLKKVLVPLAIVAGIAVVGIVIIGPLISSTGTSFLSAIFGK